MTALLSPLYLHKLPLLSELFAFLNSGKHLNRMAEPQLWAELEREQDAYQRLFASLGSALRIDARGFAWFQVDDASSNVSKTTRQLALLFMLIFEYQADLGLHLGRFTDWLVDSALLDALLEKNRLLLEAESLADRDVREMLVLLREVLVLEEPALKESNGRGVLDADRLCGSPQKRRDSRMATPHQLLPTQGDLGERIDHRLDFLRAGIRIERWSRRHAG